MPTPKERHLDYLLKLAARQLRRLNDTLNRIAVYLRGKDKTK